MKREWLVTDVTPVRSVDRAEQAILGVILAASFLSIQGTFVVVEQLCDLRTPLAP